VKSYYGFFDNSTINETSYFTCRETSKYYFVEHMNEDPDTNTNYYFGHAFFDGSINMTVVNRYLKLAKLLWKDPTIECSLITMGEIDNDVAR
jgi:hypothetical protein